MILYAFTPQYTFCTY